MKSQDPQVAIVMMNMGGPVDLDEVHPFLSRLFHDGDLIPLPMQRLLAPWIAKRRTPSIREQYASIGGGSPILKWTRFQGEGMVKLLDELSPQTAPHKSYVMFRYAQPLTEVTLAEMQKDNIKRAVAFTQYPQYSCSTTGSSLNELFRRSTSTSGFPSPSKPDQIQWSVIDRWATHPGFIHAVTENVRRALSKFQANLAEPGTKWEGNEADMPVILFSAHSLPMSVVNRGDPYISEVAMSVGAVMRELGDWPYRLVWQSQVGPSAWMGQQTSEAIKGLARLGRRNAVLVPIAFTSDHIETLFELDLEYVKEGKELGMNVQRAESLNGSPTFIRALADIATEHLQSHDPTSIQMQLRCPGCVNKTCGEQKAWLQNFS
ncbi:ferrochelatase hem15 [Ceratobasidium sp. 395]|nr:ferrochelatase hem15 [Ceratobasidium sp. 395]